MKKGVQFASKRFSKISKVQKEILDMLTKEFETPKHIALRRRTTLRAVYKIIKKLRLKGYLTRSFTKGFKKYGGCNPFVESPNRHIRLHNQQFRISILKSSGFYHSLRKKKNIFTFESHTVTLHRDSIIVSCNELKHFFGETPDKAFVSSIEYWNQYFVRLEQRLRLLIISAEKTAIKQFNAHFSEWNNELAKYCEKKRYDIKVFANEDNKLWFLIDKSWNVNEAETVHPDTAQRDMQTAVQPFFNGLRATDNYTPQFVMKSLMELIQYEQHHATNIKSHIKAIQTLGYGVQELKKEVKNLKDRFAQKKLDDFK